MATTTYVEYTGNGVNGKSFSFASYKEADIKVRVDKVLKTATTHYTISNYTTTGGGQIDFTSGNIPGKDVTDSGLRTTLSQFSLRYGINAMELNEIFSPATEARINAETIKSLSKQFLTDYYDNLGGIQDVDLRTRVENIISTLDKQSGQIEMNGETFHQLVYEPLKARIMIDRNISELAGEKLKIPLCTSPVAKLPVIPPSVTT